MSSYTLDAEQFIRAVEKHPELWNNNNEDSRHRNRRQEAWDAIARNFIGDFDDMDSSEKNDVFKKLQCKWRNIRDSFVRHKRGKYTTKKGYLYAKHLAFLEDAYKKTSRSNNDVETIQNDGDDTWPSDIDDDTKLKKILLKSEFTKAEPLGWSDDEMPMDRKRKHSDPAIEFVQANYQEPSSSFGVEDEDTSFFLSLLPAVRQFTLDQKLEFRTDVLRLIKEYRKNGEALNNNETIEHN